MLGRYVMTLPPLAAAMFRETVTADGVRLRIPGSRAIRASVLLGNVRLRALLDEVVRPGGTVIDVGANIGAIALWTARRVGPQGHVIAIEPAADNLAVLHDNVAANRFQNVRIVAGAGGRVRETREFFVRGDVSAVNSLFRDSMYGTVTSVVPVEVYRVDDLLPGPADVVKIDVEGAELDVLDGMPRLLENPAVRLIVEWHPVLQTAAGYAADALPRALFEQGFTIDAIDHLSRYPLRHADVDTTCARLVASRRPVELFARRSQGGGSR